MKTILNADEVQTLQGIQSAYAAGYTSAITPGTSKRLVEVGYVRRVTDGHLYITELGRRALFQRRSYSQLMAFAKNPLIVIQLDCQEWLSESGYIQLKSGNQQMHSFDFEITQKGWDWIANFNDGEG